MVKELWIAVLTAWMLVALPAAIGAHEGEETDEPKAAVPAMAAMETGAVKATLTAISTAYEARVKPIFEDQCADCHGAAIEKPWYYAIPGVSHLIDRDIREAREHLDLRNGFPFDGHASPHEDLESIAKVMRKGSMPPLRYRLMHRDAGLTDAELALVLEWVERSLERLEAGRSEGAQPD